MRQPRRATPEYPDGLYVVELRHVPGGEWYLDETGEHHMTEADALESARQYIADHPDVKADAAVDYELEARVVQYRRDSWSAPIRSKPQEPHP